MSPLLWVGVLLWGVASCDITCPDGNHCSDTSTCCLTKDGYACCPYPKAVCCPDLASCCPSGFKCDATNEMCVKENQPWVRIPMVEKEAAEEPNTPDLSVSPFVKLEESHPVQEKSSIVHCDNYWGCPDGTTCCRHPAGGWFCCPYSPGRCCLDGFHCCPYGFDCDHSYTRCVRQGLKYPFSPKPSLGSIPASRISPEEPKEEEKPKPSTVVTEVSNGIGGVGVIHCDSVSYCQQGQTCCRSPYGRWSCCPYPLASCCRDGIHCCQYGFTCDVYSQHCQRGYSRIPARSREPSNEI